MFKWIDHAIDSEDEGCRAGMKGVPGRRVRASSRG